MSTTDHQPDDVLDVPPVSKPTATILEKYPPMYRDQYHDFKTDFLAWLCTKGKKPFRHEGYADWTVRTTHYRTEQLFRWLWDEHGEFSLTVDTDDADAYVTGQLQRGQSDKYVYTDVKVIKRLFKFRNNTSATEYDWEYEHVAELDRSEPSQSHHYLNRHELSEFYEGALAVGSFPNYENVSPDERDRLQIVLARRLGKSKREVSPQDFVEANSWKVPSLVSVCIDVGLRPIEVKRSSVRWLDLQNQNLMVPKEEATKGKDNWECALSTRSVRALERWLNERDGFEKYDGTDAIWLTKYANPYTSNSLSSVFDRVMDETDIEEGARNLSWYAIRRGCATMWANKVGLKDTMGQLRHKKLETTQRYAHSENSARGAVIDELV